MTTKQLHSDHPSSTGAIKKVIHEVEHVFHEVEHVLHEVDQAIHEHVLHDTDKPISHALPLVMVSLVGIISMAVLLYRIASG